MNYAETINLNISDILMILSAYLMGGISTGYLLVHFIRGVDVRATGSGSFGARNVGRLLGRRGFYLTLAGDIFKGAIIVWGARWLGFQPNITGVVVVAVIVGHIWPVWLQFQGGKGIATTLGAFLAFDYKILLMGGVVLLITYSISRKFLASWVVTIVAIPILTLFLDYPMNMVTPLFISAIVVLYAHKDNIKQALLTSKYKD